MNKPPPFKGLNIRIINITPIKGRGVINHGSGLSPTTVLLNPKLLRFSGLKGYAGLEPTMFGAPLLLEGPHSEP